VLVDRGGGDLRPRTWAPIAFEDRQAGLDAVVDRGGDLRR
jgi:hypothetical protein